tara:strand:+ start:5204 stop:5383 length:180 start_codon:yes stop_codon:yes gene_type:complete
MDIIKQFERIQKRPSSKFQPGTVQRVFEIYEKSELDASGRAPIIIKPTPEEKKQKRSIN